MAIRTWRSAPGLERAEPLLSATASSPYLRLVVAVVGPNATAILERPALMLLVVAGAVVLNGTGYGLGWLAGRSLQEPAVVEMLTSPVVACAVARRGMG